MYAMAVRAGNAAALVRPGMPGVADRVGVAAEASLVLRKSTTGMWEELVKRSEQQKNLIRTRLDSTEPHPGMPARSR